MRSLNGSETRVQRWRRRAITVPAVFLGLALATALLPLLLMGTLVFDLARAVRGRGRFAATRLLLFGWWYLLAEVVGISMMLVFWIITGFGRRRAAYVSLSYRLQRAWAITLWTGFKGLLRFDVEVEGLDVTAPGPMILMMRHASMVDTVLPIVLVMRHRGIRMRYVMKRELLWDPALDVAGNVIPNYFIDRRSQDRAAEVAHIAALAGGLGDDEAVVIYPEGTRYTAEKREQVIASLARKDPAAAARAAEFHNVLPPRPGGPVALLGAGTDVVVCTHVGLDEMAEVRHLLDGSLVGARVRVAFWRIPRHEIPEGEEARLGWLTEQWSRVDRWVGDHREEQ